MAEERGWGEMMRGWKTDEVEGRRYPALWRRAQRGREERVGMRHLIYPPLLLFLGIGKGNGKGVVVMYCIVLYCIVSYRVRHV